MVGERTRTYMSRRTIPAAIVLSRSDTGVIGLSGANRKITILGIKMISHAEKGRKREFLEKLMYTARLASRTTQAFLRAMSHNANGAMNIKIA